MSLPQFQAPRLMELPQFGSGEIGFLSVIEQNRQIPFSIKRVYWTYLTPEQVVRGHHAHLELQQLIVAISGSIEMNIENLRGEKKKFVLDRPSLGLYLPPGHWRDIKFSKTAVLLCLASEVYLESDYIYSYEAFQKMQNEYKGQNQ